MTDKVVAAANQMKAWAEGEHGLFAVFDEVEKNYSKQMFDSAVEDGVLREQIYHRMNALRDLRTIMQHAINRGAGQQTIIRNMAKINQVKKVA